MFRLVLSAVVASISLAVFATAPTLADSGNACQMLRAYADTPEIVRQDGVTGTAYVTVDVNANGDVEHVSIARSSGNRWLDDAALRTAREAHFAGNCGSGETFAVDFK